MNSTVEFVNSPTHLIRIQFLAWIWRLINEEIEKSVEKKSQNLIMSEFQNLIICCVRENLV